MESNKNNLNRLTECKIMEVKKKIDILYKNWFVRVLWLGHMQNYASLLNFSAIVIFIHKT